MFYEGPPTANGMPGAHHIEARVFKDVFPRFRTMQGYHVARKAGWDCHGLPVELAVEKELGFTGKKDIEAYGIAEFNAKCRESVTRHTDAFERADERMGYWVDLDDAYRTMDPEYVESRLVVAEGDLRQGPAGPGPPRRPVVPALRHRPVGPRAGAGLRDGRRPLGLRPLPAHLRPAGRRGRALVWTTTPWTLVSNTAVAAHPDVTYVVATNGEEKLVVAEPLVAKALGEGWETTGQSFTGAEMERWTYQRPFELVEFPATRPLRRQRRVRHDRGRYGSGPPVPRLRRGRPQGLPRVRPARREPGPPRRHLRGGRAAGRRRLLQEGRRDARRGPARSAACSSGTSRTSTATRTAGAATPRCSTTRSRPGTSAPPPSRTALLEENEKTNWFPDSVKHGRFGDWLNNNIDWALSRNRYWGTPLPIWRCEEDHLTCVGSPRRARPS